VKAKQVELAVTKQAFDVGTADLALVRALAIIKTILSDIPWYKKVFRSVKILIVGIETYLRDRGWDV
jgi:hypothetical protein